LYIHITVLTREQPARTALVESAREIVAGSAAFALRAAERRVSAHIEARLRQTGLTLPQFTLMAQIAGARDDSIGALAQRSGLDQSTLSRTLRGLERAGLVEITIHEEDQRRRAVWLTERGARRLERAIPVWRSAHAALAERIGTRGLRAIVALRGVLARMGAEGG
jgi:DNA-binding MarR family transcriptional regulator